MRGWTVMNGIKTYITYRNGQKVTAQGAEGFKLFMGDNPSKKEQTDQKVNDQDNAIVDSNHGASRKRKGEGSDRIVKKRGGKKAGCENVINSEKGPVVLMPNENISKQHHQQQQQHVPAAEATAASSTTATAYQPVNPLYDFTF